LNEHNVYISSLLETAKWLDNSIKKANPPCSIDFQEVFKIHINLMSEYAKGISLLLEKPLITPSLALLRSLLETSVNLQWIATNPQENKEKYFNNRMPSIQTRFNKIGYHKEYQITYVFLNKRTHGNYESSFDCRKTSIKRLAIVPSLSHRSVQHLFIGSDGLYYIEEDTHMTNKELYQYWTSFICGKSLECILSSLRAVFSDNVRRKKWWNKNIESLLIKIIYETKNNTAFFWNYIDSQTELMLE